MKKILSFLLAFVLAIAVIPVFSTQVYAADYRIEKAIEWAIATANDDTHGYSMSSRNGPNYDCSSFVSYAFKAAGFAIKGVPSSSSMISAFGKVGFTAYKKGEVTPRRGDIFVRPGSHAELYLGNETCAAAHEDTDGKSGDSKGNEIDIRTGSKCSWCKNKQYTYVLRYNGPTTYTYTFSYNALNGNGNQAAFETEYDKDFTINYTASKEGYTLLGWNVQRCRDNTWFAGEEGWLTEEQIYQNGYSKSTFVNGSSSTFNSQWTSSVECDTEYVFYAVWKPNEYVVTFDGNGGSNIPNSQIKYHGSDLIINPTIPNKLGNAFLGWAESPNATIPTYQPGSTYYINSNTTLFAVWGKSFSGDLYGDGKIDTIDFALFKLLLINYDDPAEEDATFADCNNDGYVDTSDLATMKIYLSGVTQITSK